MSEPVFYEEDGIEIIDAITYMMEHKGVERLIVRLEGGKSAKIYWSQNKLMIDIEGLKK